LVKRYVEERGSDVVRSLLRKKGEVAVSRVTAVELSAALARRAREGSVALDVAQRQAQRFLADLAHLRVVEVRPALVERAADLVWRHALRAYDALQLASGLLLRDTTGLALTFICSDGDLRDAAAAEGLRVLRVG
jgi:uncharacterized protein